MSWLRQLFSRRRLYGELTEEIQAHLDEKIEELVAEGMSREEARHSARREFGNVGLAEENSREVWRWPSIEDFLMDVSYGLRTLRHNPVFTAVGLLTIAIGIGANTAVFSVVNSVLLKPLNYPKAEELVALHQIAPGAAGLADFENGLLLSPSMYFTYAEQNRTFQSLGVWVTGTANVTGLVEPEQVRTVGVSDGVLQALGVPPEAGRWFLLADRIPNGAERVMLSYGYWQRRFGGDRAVIGRNVMVDSRPREIVGVMPQGFRFVDADFDVMMPFAFNRGTYLRDVENHADDSTVETGSDRQRERIVVGGDGDDWLGDVDWLRECSEFVAGAGGGATAGVGRSRGAWGGLGTHRARTACGKRDAGVDGWGDWCRLGICGRTFSRDDRSGESASIKRNLD